MLQRCSWGHESRRRSWVAVCRARQRVMPVLGERDELCVCRSGGMHTASLVQKPRRMCAYKRAMESRVTSHWWLFTSRSGLAAHLSDCKEHAMLALEQACRGVDPTPLSVRPTAFSPEFLYSCKQPAIPAPSTAPPHIALVFANVRA